MRSLAEFKTGNADLWVRIAELALVQNRRTESE
jgi:hypothetical protein